MRFWQAKTGSRKIAIAGLAILCGAVWFFSQRPTSTPTNPRAANPLTRIEQTAEFAELRKFENTPERTLAPPTVQHPEGSVRPVNWLQQADADSEPIKGAYSLVSISPANPTTAFKDLVWPISEKDLALNPWAIPLAANSRFQITFKGPANLSNPTLSLKVTSVDKQPKPESFTVTGKVSPSADEEEESELYTVAFAPIQLPGPSVISVSFVEASVAQTVANPEIAIGSFQAIPVDTISRIYVSNATHSEYRKPNIPIDQNAITLFKTEVSNTALLRFSGIDAQRSGEYVGYLINDNTVIDQFEILVDQSSEDQTYLATANIPLRRISDAYQSLRLMVGDARSQPTKLRLADQAIPHNFNAKNGSDWNVGEVVISTYLGNGSKEPSDIDKSKTMYTVKSLQSIHVTAKDWSDDFDLIVEQLQGGQFSKVLSGRTMLSSPNESDQNFSADIPIGIPASTRPQEVKLRLAAYAGDSRVIAFPVTYTFLLLDKPLRVEHFEQNGIGTIAGANEVTLRFPQEQKLELTEGADDGNKKHFNLYKSSDAVVISPESAFFSVQSNSVILKFPNAKLTPDEYRLEITGLTDIYKNGIVVNNPAVLSSGWVEMFGASVGVVANGSVLPGQVMPGIHGATGEYVAYQEWTPPRDTPDGFNQSDKVETRVAPLYFFRDAHRVAQIINRKVKSHNRHGVSMARQHADQARTRADQTTAARQQAEREAIRKAQQTRELEQKLSDARSNFDKTLQQLRQTSQQRNSTDPENEDALTALNSSAAAMEQAVRTFSAEVKRLEGEVDTAKQAELDAREQSEQLESREQLARQEQFRREVFAAHADPDTYAEGVPNSSDPVEQTSISVIGEGLIHLRGPLKGVNQIRLMINQIDTPVGQVRVNVHSTQINGDDAKRLETVASRIQTYIDQARFMTVQTGEMIRKSVMLAAAERAEQACTMYPGATQQERDERYLYSFFGHEFIDELKAMDSEFLHTGNKLLSLHSMDVTSLSSALLLMSLANNETRVLILSHLDQQLREELPLAEQNYLDAGMHHSDGKIHICTDACGNPCSHHTKLGSAFRRMWDKHHGPPPLVSLSQNAAFQSLRGFYSANGMQGDTMTPLQREFIRLAQIFKSRLITELEYKQRVMERALIEDRLGNRQQELLSAKEKENEAKRELYRAQQAKSEAIQNVVVELTKAQSEIRKAVIASSDILKWFDANFSEFINDLTDTEQRVEVQNFRLNSSRTLSSVFTFYGSIIQEGVEFHFAKQDAESLDHSVIMIVADPKHNTIIETQIIAAVNNAIKLATELSQYTLDNRAETIRAKLAIVRKDVIIQPSHSVPQLQLDYKSLEDFADLYMELKSLVTQTFGEIQDLSTTRLRLLEQLKDPEAKFTTYYTLWQSYQHRIERTFQKHPRKQYILYHMNNVNEQFNLLLEVDVQANFKIQEANDARRPLDHKKFLDMLIDDLEEKYIELLEGTRAHTANIDNYLKRLTTALDDDFNTQFYYPTFRNIREGSQYKDVEFGQTETTNVLANNRAFAKVSPSATMEFDLPKRDILIREGIDSALAIYNDVGALVNDPNLLALAASQGGLPTSQVVAGQSGMVRDVLPGLQSDTQADMLAQDAGNRPRYESNVEKLIPDPAIYKFETGTGYEIRPVIEPDGQAVVFDFNYMYTTNVREPVRADEKHLGRVKRHFIDTDVQLSNFELREVSRYTVALKAERTARGVPLLEDIPVVGALWRPVPNRESSLQQNIIMAQATIFPTLFDLMGLRWAPAVAELDPLSLSNREFIVRGRHHVLENRVYDVSSSRVDESLRFPASQRRADLYRSQSTIPSVHPNGYRGPGLDYQNSDLDGGFDVNRAYPESQFVPATNGEGVESQHLYFTPGTIMNDMDSIPSQPNTDYATPQLSDDDFAIPEPRTGR
ncbi:hypothetical protein [Rhodopirellula sp. MGV]|uniref:hypothetical protein n=1 Tax=Rhodopirellula sp. MGV TaxID=2023130 RepID=UPI000B960780|nr:hypothetical protein [Rhodopirellula sp. MGV]OYP28396.1 hypothetical protein CGZ80_26660 [Rhodopirellula sp. MGV]PNY38729.1 hypothetical protein C2E31_02130 [Rhodopirellula baltica]